MVLFVEEVGIWDLLESIDVVYLGNKTWDSSRVEVFDQRGGGPSIIMGYTASVARVINYSHDSGFWLAIAAPQAFYMYDAWCRTRYYSEFGMALKNACEASNNYADRNLEPPKSLYTVVPTQLSSFV